MVLFLHGRGYARSSNAHDGMLDHLQLNTFFDQDEFKDFVFIAPHDIFIHSDSNSIGQDYWLGTEGRNW